MTENNNLLGSEVTLWGGVWALVEDADGDTLWGIDKDGAELSFTEQDIEIVI